MLPGCSSSSTSKKHPKYSRQGRPQKKKKKKKLQLPLPISSQHTSIFSIRAFSAPPTDGQLLFTFFIAKQQLLRLDSLTFMVFMYSFKCTLHIIWVTCSLRGRGGMTTSCLCFTHGWLCWVSFFFSFFFLLGQNAQQKRQRQRGRERGEDREREKRVRGVCMSECCKIKLDPRLFFFFFFFPLSATSPGSKRPSCGPACPPGQSGALFAANVYAENTWTEFELPYDVGLFLAVMSCWQQGLPQTIQSLPERSNTQFVAPAAPPKPPHTHTHTHTHARTASSPPPPSIFMSIYISLSLTHTHTHTHTQSETRTVANTHTRQRGCDSCL